MPMSATCRAWDALADIPFPLRHPGPRAAPAPSPADPPPAEALTPSERAGWEQILGKLERRALALAWRILGDAHLAADAVQEGFLRACRERDALRDRAKPEAWILAVVANAARDFARGRARREAVLSDAAQRPAPTEPQDPATLRPDEAEDRLQAALAELDEPSRVAFLLVHQEGLSYQDVAGHFGWPIGTVRSKLHRARLQLRERLGRPGGAT